MAEGRRRLTEFWWTWLVLGVSIVSLTAASWIAVTNSPQSPLVQDDVPTLRLIEPVAVESDLSTAVEVQLIRRDGAVARWPGSQGIVTSVAIESGSKMTSGDVVATVDERSVVALRTARPLFRNIAAGTQGDDVAEAASALASLGLLGLDQTDSRVTTPIRQAIHAFNLAIGIESYTLEADSILWLPVEVMTIGSVDLEVGAMAPAPGAIVVRSPSVLAAGRVTVPGEPGRDIALLDGPSIVKWQGHRLEMDGSALAKTALSIVSEMAADSDEMLRPATMSLREPRPAFRIPASAVMSGSDGTTCLVSSSLSPVAVEPVGGGAGFVEVAGDPPPEIIDMPLSWLEPEACTARG